MKKVLIVEDEKMIRLGLKAMIQRTNIPVETIIECNNGQTALEILQEQSIDLMFTDIRMPKMDGITLVKEMQACDHIPMTIAISGYDDFQYAVEMMRQGVREYLLKPIERDKITTIMQKAEQEIQQKEKEKENNRHISKEQLKYLITKDKLADEDVQVLETQYGPKLNREGYYLVCKMCADSDLALSEEIIYLNDVAHQDILLVKASILEEILQLDVSEYKLEQNKLYLSQDSEINDKTMPNDIMNLRDYGTIQYAGISNKYVNASDLPSAYKEACHRREIAFCKSVDYVGMYEEEHLTRFPEDMLQEATRLLSNQEKMKRLQLLGTNRQEELEKNWNRFLKEVASGRMAPKDFLDALQEFFQEFLKVYRNTMKDTAKCYEQFLNPLTYPNLQVYADSLVNWLVCVQKELHDPNQNQGYTQKMEQAITYIKENYAKDINMAVISNMLSMNYSLFSFTFKQYTGKNFVNYLKDIRMEEAKKLLTHTDDKVNQISQQIGYDNEKHFMKTFKNYYGVSPTEYRKNMRT